MKTGVRKATKKHHHSRVTEVHFVREEMERGKGRETKGEFQKGVRYRHVDEIQERRVIGGLVDKIIGKWQNALEKTSWTKTLVSD